MGFARDNREWITIREAVARMPVPVSKSTLRRWVEEGRHGIVAGRFGARLVVRADSLPMVEKEPGLGTEPLRQRGPGKPRADRDTAARED
ncbi:helix-turn-helix domain-containing protein [bacterium]|nr:helix-turn-helix domain-containing protein [bacterium]